MKHPRIKIWRMNPSTAGSLPSATVRPTQLQAASILPLKRFTWTCQTDGACPHAVPRTRVPATITATATRTPYDAWLPTAAMTTTTTRRPWAESLKTAAATEPSRMDRFLLLPARRQPFKTAQSRRRRRRRISKQRDQRRRHPPSYFSWFDTERLT